MYHNLDYLKNYPLSTHGGKTLPTRVIHEGLQNRPDIAEELNLLLSELQKVKENTTSHLSDIAWKMNNIAKKLAELSVETFQAHTLEKETVIE